jgi:hypothetical protein
MYHLILLSQTAICSGILPMALRSTLHHSLALSISVPTVTVCTYPNQKPWITGNIRTELKGRAAAFKERDSNPETYKKSRYALQRTIKQADNTGLRSTRTAPAPTLADVAGLANYYRLQREAELRELPSDTSLPDVLNNFYARFEACNTESVIPTCFIPETLDPLQFAYCRSTDDAISVTLPFHTWTKGSPM